MGVGSHSTGLGWSLGAGWPAIHSTDSYAPQGSASAQPSTEKVFPPACLSGQPAAHSSGGGYSPLSPVPQELYCPAAAPPAGTSAWAQFPGRQCILTQARQRCTSPCEGTPRHPGSSVCSRLRSKSGVRQPSQSSNTANCSARPAFPRVQGESTFPRKQPLGTSSSEFCFFVLMTEVHFGGTPSNFHHVNWYPPSENPTVESDPQELSVPCPSPCSGRAPQH